MAQTKAILTSLHGKLAGLSRDIKLVVGGFTHKRVNDGGTEFGVQGTPGTLNATGTLTAALLQSGIVTSSTAAAVVATLDTGAAMDTAFGGSTNCLLQIGDSFDWSAINTGGANAFTVTASSGHTIVGAGAVALGTSGRFRTLRTAANTYVTYRL
jgi:hypothetical protein